MTETVVVSGALANKHLNGGEAWVRLSWVLGFKRLGFDVRFIEQVTAPSEAQHAYFSSVVEAFALDGRAVLVDEAEPVAPDLLELAESAELLVNISGHLQLDPLFGRFRRKAYVDIDPGFTQLWEATGVGGSRLDGHDWYFTIGENIGTPGCRIPTLGIEWRHIRQPVVLEEWPVSSGGDPARFSTVATWRGPYGPIEFEGRSYGLKVHQFRRFVALPGRVAQTFELALDIDPAEERDLGLLREHGWRLVDPREVVPDPSAFRRYVQQSGAEFSVAQGIYVETQNGWFSDRTARYLASGKPALVQDTGLSGLYPLGEGLVTFRTFDEAVEGVERIARDYEAHCEAARELAATHFDSDRVLERLLDDVAVGV